MYVDKKAELIKILNEKNIRTVFQPIFDVKNAKIIGYEALSRGPLGSVLERPDELFNTAREYDMLWEIELLCRSLAIERASEKGLDKFLFLNVDPRIIRDVKFKEGFTNKFIKSFNIEPQKIIFEITEKTAIEDYKAFKEVLDHYVRQGYKIAIDDTGAGYSGMRLITETKPQFIKLDMELIRDIDKDSFKQALCRNLLTLSKITNMKLIAEGVETVNEVNTLINIGVEYLQGYFLARPCESFQDISQDVAQYIKDIVNDKKREKLYSSKTYPVGKISRIDEAISLSYKGSELKRYFENSKVQGVAVVEDKIPVGLIMKNKFNSMLAMPYGNAIYLGRNIDIMMDHNPLIVDYSTPIAEVSCLAMARQEENLYDYIIVTKDMEYYGIVTVKRLLESATELELKYARHLNPLTGLPGNVVIEEKLNNIINTKNEAGIFYIDLDNFKAYNDIYGFESGDKIIKLVAQVIYDVVDKYASGSSFIGHIGGDDFIIITENCSYIEVICREIIEKFDNYIAGFYNIDHLNDGYIISTDREGNMKKFELMSISIAVIKGHIYELKTIFTIAQKAAQIKKKCKKESISNYIIESIRDIIYKGHISSVINQRITSPFRGNTNQRVNFEGRCFLMPRIARQKTNDAIFHVMARSISEVDLFKDDEDKVNYLALVKKYQKTYEFRVYGYCLMDNHLHLIIDANGADISRIMHSINFSYAQYFNHRHKRHGHLFQDRFKSKMVKSEIYLYALSAYVHNNPCDIKGYEKCPEQYEFSSLSIYLGLRHDPYELVEDGFIMGMFSKNSKKARESYMRLVYKCSDKVFKEEVEFLNEGTEYRSERKILVRNIKTKEILEFIASKMGIEKIKLHTKHCREIVEAKALAVLLMRSLCNLKCSEICRVLGNITQSRVSMLSSLGVKLLDEEKYRNITQEFMVNYA